MLTTSSLSILAPIEPRLRAVLPPELYVAAWMDPSPANLTRVFEHLRTMQRILYDYVPRQVSERLPKPGEIRFAWEEGTLMFTDLAGFTSLMEAGAARGRQGAADLLKIINAYFAQMIAIIGKAGGNLLEFTGDAMLVQFEADRRRTDTARAVRAGLRMQRAMKQFVDMDTAWGHYTLGMRIGLHTGRFLIADVGTPQRMEHVLLGHTVTQTKHAEGSGKVGRVNLSAAAHQRVQALFRCEPGKDDYQLVIDDLSEEQLGEYDLTPASRRAASMVLMDRSVEGLLKEIESVLRLVEPLASYLPSPILSLVVEGAARRQIRPDFPAPTVLFVNVVGLPEAIDAALPGEEPIVVASFSRIFALINAAIEARGGLLKKVTYHLTGSNLLIYFGSPNAHHDDAQRAAATALAIRQIVSAYTPPTVGGQTIQLTSHIGLASGPVFVAEIGEPRGRREFNILGDPVNIAARLMSRADDNQILLTEAVAQTIEAQFALASLGPIVLKGKTAVIPVYALEKAKE
jgi:class 3 adenylate cyclase